MGVKNAVELSAKFLRKKINIQKPLKTQKSTFRGFLVFRKKTKKQILKNHLFHPCVRRI